MLRRNPAVLLSAVLCLATGLAAAPGLAAASPAGERPAARRTRGPRSEGRLGRSSERSLRRLSGPERARRLRLGRRGLRRNAFRRGRIRGGAAERTLRGRAETVRETRVLGGTAEYRGLGRRVDLNFQLLERGGQRRIEVSQSEPGFSHAAAGERSVHLVTSKGARVELTVRTRVERAPKVEKTEPFSGGTVYFFRRPGGELTNSSRAPRDRVVHDISVPRGVDLSHNDVLNAAQLAAHIETGHYNGVVTFK